MALSSAKEAKRGACIRLTQGKPTILSRGGPRLQNAEIIIVGPWWGISYYHKGKMSVGQM